jgi:flagellar hook-basal body complex protein FliE
MTDPLGIIGRTAGPGREFAPGALSPMRPEGVPEFKQFLHDQIEAVNRLQQDAKTAIEDVQAGRRTDVESVMIATQKADTAFKLLMQVRNKVMEAYDEFKQLRV